MRTTNKAFKSQVQDHVIDRLMKQDDLLQIYDIEVTEDNYLATQLEAVKHEFHNWYNPYEQKRTPNHQEAFIDWTQELPSCLDIEYTHHNINEKLKEWYTNVGAEYKEQPTDKQVNQYNALVYREINTLMKQNKIDLF